MFKVTEKGGVRSRAFKTWGGCVEYQCLLVRQGRRFDVQERIDGEWVLLD